jgi:hypothetical protein
MDAGAWQVGRGAFSVSSSKPSSRRPSFADLDSVLTRFPSLLTSPLLLASSPPTFDVLPATLDYPRRLLSLLTSIAEQLSSASNCTDYQSRRLGIRYRPSSTSTAPSKTLFAHTLNATAAAIPRLIVALVENGAVLGEKGEVLKMRFPVCLKRFWLGSGELGEVGEGGVIEWVEEGEALREV